MPGTYCVLAVAKNNIKTFMIQSNNCMNIIKVQLNLEYTTKQQVRTYFNTCPSSSTVAMVAWNVISRSCSVSSTRFNFTLEFRSVAVKPAKNTHSYKCILYSQNTVTSEGQFGLNHITEK